MIYLYGVGAVGIVVAYLYIKQKILANSFAKLNAQKDADTAQLTQVKVDESNLKAEATKEQANATEQQKTDFWQNELDKK